jgi:membrane protein YdbS with pleckstrin-like domain
MQEFEHIQSLWDAHKVEVKISSEEMLAQVKKEVNGIRTKSLFNITGMGLSFLAIASIWLFYHVQNWTTHAGLTIIISSIAIYTFILYRSHKLISKTDFTLHPGAFLDNLKQYQLNRFSLYNKLYWIYAIALSIGCALYFFEILGRFDLWVQCLVIAFSFGWMLFCSALVRKVALKRERERIALLIEKFERLGVQFKEPE